MPKMGSNGHTLPTVAADLERAGSGRGGQVGRAWRWRGVVGAGGGWSEGAVAKAACERLEVPDDEVAVLGVGHLEPFDEAGHGHRETRLTRQGRQDILVSTRRLAVDQGVQRHAERPGDGAEIADLRAAD